MPQRRILFFCIAAILIQFGFQLAVSAQSIDPALFSGMRWRLIGPFRAGRTLTAVGVPGRPDLFYMGSVDGGVWKSTDAGTTWDPIFDSQPIASIGDLAVAPSNPNIIYVGTGEPDMRSDITYGNGMYKSTDGGNTWTHIGLEDSRQIARILINPHNPDLVYVAALGHAYGANHERGVFRSSDGGHTWSAVLHPNDDTGAIDLAFDPQDARVIYAAMWQTRRPPWNIYPPSNGPGSGLYKSIDGGSTWQQLKTGLPTEGLGRIGIAVAPTDHNRVYLIVDAKKGGLYRSDDAGETWTLADNEARIWARGWYFGRVTVDPHNADVVYVASVCVYKSVDGGKNFVAFKGAPGGDDYHSVWIDPADSDRMVVSSDQGTVISLNGGKTWSSWYNQPTAQLYHVSTDNSFPYWIYAAQQDTGAIRVPSRSNYSSITQQDWHAVSVGGENGYLFPDPGDANIVFGGDVSRYDVNTGQDHNVSPTIGLPGTFRTTWTLPLAFSPPDPHKLYFSHQMLFRTVNGGQSWDQISPDLTRENPGVPTNLDPVTAGYGLASPRKGVIYAIAPSPLDSKLVWIGTDDGLIQLTSDDGQHWNNVTPSQLTPWSKVGIIEASHYDKEVAYASVDRHRLDDLRPYIYRTRDGGKSWQLIAHGIPDGDYVNVVREDPKRRGLLFAGTELGIFVSFDDGDNWEPVQENLPVVSIRDIAIHDNDLVVATHGRSIWILDDISPLREIAPSISGADAYLYQPATAIRTRPGSDQATPFPPETPHGDNPPNGALLYFYLKQTASTPVTLEILDGHGTVVRRYASDDKVPPVNEKSLRIPLYWIHPAEQLATTAGMHRFVWDMHYASHAPATTSYGRPVEGPWAPPGQYTARLVVSGKNYDRPLTLTKDPRVPATPTDLQAQFEAAWQCEITRGELARASTQASKLQEQLQQIQTQRKANARLASLLEETDGKLSKLLGPPARNYGAPVIPLETDETSLRHLSSALTELQDAIESADAAPTREQGTALQSNQATAHSTLEQWAQFTTTDIPVLNQALSSAGLSQITMPTQ